MPAHHGLDKWTILAILKSEHLQNPSNEIRIILTASTAKDSRWSYWRMI